jgi:hypothetical protein
VLSGFFLWLVISQEDPFRFNGKNYLVRKTNRIFRRFYRLKLRKKGLDLVKHRP